MATNRTNFALHLRERIVGELVRKVVAEMSLLQAPDPAQIADRLLESHHEQAVMVAFGELARLDPTELSTLIESDPDNSDF